MNGWDIMQRIRLLSGDVLSVTPGASRKRSRAGSSRSGARWTSPSRARRRPYAVVAAVRKEMQAIVREAPLSHITTMTGAVERAMAPRIFNLVLLALFAGAALLLCVVGICGVISYSVAQRTSEIGVRMTLGAQRSDVLRPGVAGALLLGRLVEGLPFGVRPADPVTYGAVILILVVVAALAPFVPARRATTRDLVSALRGN